MNLRERLAAATRPRVVQGGSEASRPGIGRESGAGSVLDRLRALGVTAFADLRFRDNRRTILSVSRDGRTLYLHAGFRHAPPEVLAELAAILGAGGRRDAAALRRIRAWISTTPELRRARAGRPRSSSPGGRSGSWTPGPCAGTIAQRRFLRRVYGTLNQECFDGSLPAALHLRLSRRMSSRLGHAGSRPGPGGTRTPLEIALNVDLLLAGNEGQLRETLLHEMAHVADALLHGGRGHGASWREIARRAGCEPRARTAVRIIRRPTRGAPVTRVPPLPLPAPRQEAA